MHQKERLKQGIDGEFITRNKNTQTNKARLHCTAERLSGKIAKTYKSKKFKMAII